MIVADKIPHLFPCVPLIARQHWTGSRTRSWTGGVARVEGGEVPVPDRGSGV
jgi:hypothetical protein